MGLTTWPEKIWSKTNSFQVLCFLLKSYLVGRERNLMVENQYAARSGIWALCPRESSFCHGPWTFGEIPLSPKTGRAIWTKCFDSVQSGTLIRERWSIWWARLSTAFVHPCMLHIRQQQRKSVFQSLLSITSAGGIEPFISAELVRETAGQMEATIRHLKATLPDWLPGYRVKILDGNAIAATEHRLKKLRCY